MDKEFKEEFYIGDPELYSHILPERDCSNLEKGYGFIRNTIEFKLNPFQSGTRWYGSSRYADFINFRLLFDLDPKCAAIIDEFILEIPKDGKVHTFELNEVHPEELFLVAENLLRICKFFGIESIEDTRRYKKYKEDNK